MNFKIYFQKIKMESRISSYNKRLIEELCAEHNKLRKNPESYIGILKKVLNLIRRSNILHLKGERPFKTIEGKEAVLEAINYLSNIPKTLVEKLSNRLFIISDELNLASLDHAEDIGFNGGISHVGSDKSHMNDRVEKYCEWNGGLAESLDFGTNSAENIMIKLLICDGDKKRSQRKYIFDPGFIYFGAGFSQHIKYKRCSVISYAADIQSKDADLSEKELIQKCIDIHENFQNKNIKEIKEYFNNNKINKNNEENEMKEEIVDKKEEEINDNDDGALSFRSNGKIEEVKEVNDNLLIIEEKENDNEKEEKNSEIINNEGIKKIKERQITRYGLKIKETTYQIKEGNFHIVEEESGLTNFNFIKLI